MAEFLDTTAISHQIEQLIKSARQEITLISPYLRLRERVRQLIGDALALGVAVNIVYGKKEACKEVERLRTLNGINVAFCENVHAKCYLNEEAGIVTSLNLYDFSQGNNQEMGILFRRSSDAELYQSVHEEAKRILRIAGGAVARQASAKTVQQAEAEPGKLKTGKLADKMGIMITALYDKLLGCGYLELRNGKRVLTDKGRAAGGVAEPDKGSSFLWPVDLQV
jgi:phosphatidylserine/phosphatidylglycerophosphate/cardiolipin synthase-like enzyme